MKGGNWITALILVGLVAGALVGQLMHADYDEADAVARIAAARRAVAAGTASEDQQALAATSPSQAWTLHPHGEALKYFHFVGSKVFMNALKMLIIPLIVTSMVVGVTSVGHFGQLGRIGLKTLVYYFATMLLAVSLGLVLVHVARPGDGMAEAMGGAEAMAQRAAAAYEDSGQAATVEANRPAGLGGAMLRIVEEIIPANFVEAMAEGDALPVIFFSLLFGVLLTTVGPVGLPVRAFFEGSFAVLMKMVHVVLWLAPLGVFCLLAWTIARIGLSVFASAIGGYMAVVLAGLGLHGLVVLPLILWLLGRTNPYRFGWQMKPALLTAFGTDSSSATLPVTLECATEQGGVSRKAAGFVLPLGATINMDGTALYEAVAVAFLAQCYGIELTLGMAVVIALTATLAAVGAAGIPSAGLVTMVIVFQAVNSLLAGQGVELAIPATAIGLILGVDRLLDMCRTTVNVWGDAVGAKIITRTEPDDQPAPAARVPQQQTAG